MPHDPQELSSTVMDVSDLIDQPGASRQVGLDVPAPQEFEVPLTRFGEIVAVDGVLESLVDGILLRGTVSADVDQTCSRCLEALPTATVAADVAELFSDPATAEVDGDIEVGYTIGADRRIDIDALVRDALAAATTAAPRCRPDCAGLCPTCGINRNRESCNCADVPVDDRWSALSNLKLSDLKLNP